MISDELDMEEIQTLNPDSINSDTSAVTSSSEVSPNNLFLRKLSFEEFRNSEECKLIMNIVPQFLIKNLLMIEADREFGLGVNNYWSKLNDPEDCISFNIVARSPFVIYQDYFDELKRTQQIKNLLLINLNPLDDKKGSTSIYFDSDRNKLFYYSPNGKSFIKDLKYHLNVTLDRLIRKIEANDNLDEGISMGCRRTYNRLRLIISTSKISQYNY